MREAHDHLINDLIDANGARHPHRFRVLRPLGDEVMLVESAHFGIAHTTGHDRDVVDIGIGHHRLHGGLNIVEFELISQVLIEYPSQINARLRGAGPQGFCHAPLPFLSARAGP
jgi:hypothetical protein